MHVKNQFAATLHNHHLYAVIILGCAMVVTYFASLGHDFVFWDDPVYVVYNEAAKGFSLDHLRQAFSRSYISNYAPLQIVSYMLDYEIWGLNPKGFILTNLLLHFMNGLLVYHLYTKWMQSTVVALCVAVIFLVHPLQIESVVWISQRKNVLSLFFFLVSFVCYSRWRAAETRINFSYWFSVICYALALLTKVAAIVLPIILYLYDLSRRDNRPLRDRLRSYAPYILLSVIMAIVAVITQRYSLEGVPVVYYAGNGYKTALTMITAFPLYFFNIFCPRFLSIIYSPPVKEAMDGEVIVGLVLLLLFILEGAVLFKRRKELFFWYVFFFVAFIPVLQIIPLPTIMQDRYCYYPLMGFCGFVGLVADNCLQQAKQWLVKLTVIALLAVPIPLLMMLAQQKAAIWQDPPTLFRETARLGIGSRYGINVDFVNFTMAEICYTMATGYRGKASDAEVIRYFMESLSYEPLYYNSLVQVGFMLLERGNYPAAQKYFVRVTENFGRSFEGFYGLGRTYQRSGHRAQATAAYRQALSLNPVYAPALKALAEL